MSDTNSFSLVKTADDVWSLGNFDTMSDNRYAIILFFNIYIQEEISKTTLFMY